MRDDLTEQYRRWLEADEQGDDDEADAAFDAALRRLRAGAAAVGPVHETTMAAMAEASGRDAVRAAAAAAGAALVGSADRRGWRSTSAPARRCRRCPPGSSPVSICWWPLVVWFANGHDMRSTVWTLLTGIGRAALAFAADPRVTVAMLVFQVVAVAALAALHRLLGPEREWLK